MEQRKSQKLPFILSDLERSMDIIALTSFFSVSKNFFKLLCPIKEQRGRCIICDTYFGKINKHLRQVHSLNTNCFTQYGEIFAEASYYYMPLDFKKLEERTGGKKKFKIQQTSLDDNRVMLTNSIAMRKIIPEFKNYSRIELVNSNSFICAECGKVVTKSQKSDHIRNHRKNEIVECPVCMSRMKKRQLSSHSKTCGVHIIEI